MRKFEYVCEIVNILAVKVDNFNKKEILEKIEYFLEEEKFHQIATVNPEFILQARKDAEFKNILNQCDLNVADGAGIWFAFLRFGKYLKARIAGIDLMQEILKIADEKKLGVFLIANDRGLSYWEETADAIRNIYPDLRIGGINLDKDLFHHPLEKGEVKGDLKNKISVLNPSSASRTLSFLKGENIIFCSFGSPHQEKFLHSLKNQKNGKIRLAMGVGGSFDYLTGKVRRAPVFMRKLGLEWLWRLIQQPKRLKRIWNAVIIFPIKILFSR